MSLVACREAARKKWLAGELSKREESGDRVIGPNREWGY
jgi:hypothetical protein